MKSWTPAESNVIGRSRGWPPQCFFSQLFFLARTGAERTQPRSEIAQIELLIGDQSHPDVSFPSGHDSRQTSSCNIGGHGSSTPRPHTRRLPLRMAPSSLRTEQPAQVADASTRPTGNTTFDSNCRTRLLGNSLFRACSWTTFLTSSCRNASPIW